MPPLVTQLRSLGEDEAEKILIRLMRRAKASQWDRMALLQTLHIPKAFPGLAPAFVSFLGEIPPSQRNAPLIPLIRDDPWAKEMLVQWESDKGSPLPVRRAIAELGKKA
jgi:hypothetical protein